VLAMAVNAEGPRPKRRTAALVPNTITMLMGSKLGCPGQAINVHSAVIPSPLRQREERTVMGSRRIADIDGARTVIRVAGLFSAPEKTVKKGLLAHR